ncbi:uncharacterized protein LOC144504566 [Mustelus asterias]
METAPTGVKGMSEFSADLSLQGKLDHCRHERAQPAGVMPEFRTLTHFEEQTLELATEEEDCACSSDEVGAAEICWPPDQAGPSSDPPDSSSTEGDFSNPTVKEVSQLSPAPITSADTHT